MQIYPGSKTTYFNQINQDSRITFDEILFFNNESRNKNVKILGVTMWLIKDGVIRAEINAGVKS